jgi:predicted AAA+ superfamily ATPase
MDGFKRTVTLKDAHRKSHFFFGPRQTGKSTLLNELFPMTQKVNLLNEAIYADFAAEPGLLYKRFAHLKNQLVIIDEIQRIPSLLNDVQLLIEENRLKFILTGSSVRQLKAPGVNLLGGRALETRLHPITYPEFLTHSQGKDPIEQLTTIGGMPSILTSSEPVRDLQSYVNLYLYHEVKEGANVRKMKSFSKFLKIAANETSRQLNMSAIASDSGVSRDTVYEYFKILQDTLMGELLEPFQAPIRKPVSTSKFYLFDVGLANLLSERLGSVPGMQNFGISLEHFVWRELRSYLDYSLNSSQLSFWRTQGKAPLEVDFILSKNGKIAEVGIEVKSATTYGNSDFKGLLALSEKYPKMRKILVYMGKERLTEGGRNGVQVWPLKLFLEGLWAKEFT